jgi:type IV secretory pathway VirB10-like protein
MIIESWRNRGKIFYGNIYMKRLIEPTIVRLLAGGVLLLAAGLSYAQYAWIDAKGMRQYSDRPPPPSTPQDKILKAPRGSLPALVETMPVGAAKAAPQDASAPPSPQGPPTLAQREAGYRQRVKDHAEHERKAAEEAQHKAEQAESCAAARQNKAQLESGVRIGSASPQDGERGYISDAERAQRTARANQILEGCR